MSTINREMDAERLELDRQMFEFLKEKKKKKQAKRNKREEKRDQKMKLKNYHTLMVYLELCVILHAKFKDI